jgi:hypothetical protein
MIPARSVRRLLKRGVCCAASSREMPLFATAGAPAPPPRRENDLLHRYPLKCVYGMRRRRGAVASRGHAARRNMAAPARRACLVLFVCLVASPGARASDRALQQSGSPVRAAARGIAPLPQSFSLGVLLQGCARRAVAQRTAMCFPSCHTKPLRQH